MKRNLQHTALHKYHLISQPDKIKPADASEKARESALVMLAQLSLLKTVATLKSSKPVNHK